MKVATAQPVQTASARRVRRPNAGNGEGAAFVSMLDGDGAGMTERVEQRPLAGAVGGILTVQNVDDATSRRTRGVRHGHTILDRLDQIRAGLLAGLVPHEQLNGLIRAVTAERTMITDPRLLTVLDEIDLRARVELAKLSVEP